MASLSLIDCQTIEVSEESEALQDQVTFHGVEGNVYPVGGAVRCSYKISSSLKLCSYDWVGLFEAGSSLPAQHIYYMWSPLPKNYVKGRDIENCVVFPGHRMPVDDGKLYQFLYFSANGKICGKSKPFVFKVPSRNDDVVLERLVIEKEEVGETVDSETRTSALEAKFGEVTEENMRLKEKLVYMDDIQTQLEEELKQEKKQTEQLKSRLQEKTEESDRREMENQALRASVAKLEERLSSLSEASTVASRKSLNDPQREDTMNSQLHKSATFNSIMKLGAEMNERLDMLLLQKQNEDKTSKVKELEDQSERHLLMMKAVEREKKELEECYSWEVEFSDAIWESLKEEMEKRKDEQGISAMMKLQLERIVKDVEEMKILMSESEHSSAQ